jgi:hypothetical protein
MTTRTSLKAYIKFAAWLIFYGKMLSDLEWRRRAFESRWAHQKSLIGALTQHYYIVVVD